MECPECGNPFSPRRNGGKPQRFCSIECKNLASNRAWRDRNRPELAAGCAECGGPIQQSGRGRPRRFCSEKCKTKAGNKRSNRARLPLRQAHDPRPCIECGSVFVPKRADRLYCYDRWCAQTAYQRRVAEGAPHRVKSHDVKCAECGVTFTASYPTARWCSRLCANRHWGRVRSRRRRPMSSVPYTDREIFERDGWRCHICRKPVRRSAKVPHALAPTIDHLVPVSCGGSDEPSNVACAHWKCNRDKGAGAANDQLRLM